jgi:hypothetical protein
MNNRFFRRVVILSVLALFTFTYAHAQKKTDINNAAAAKMLVGRHKLSLQWISWDYFGIVTEGTR